MTRMMLKDVEWEKIKNLLPSHEGKKGRPRKNDRLVIEGILWILRTGAPWRDLPSEFGKWKTVYWRFYVWSHQHVWEKIWSFLKNRHSTRNTYY